MKIRTDGSRSTKMDRGTYFPLPVSVKKVSKEPPSAASLASGSGRPSAFRPCSRRYLRNKVRTYNIVSSEETCYSKEKLVSLQFPGTVTELGTGLTNMEVADLCRVNID